MLNFLRKSKIDQMHPVYGSEEAEALKKYILDGGWCSEFKHTEVFENMIAEFTGAKYCCAVNNGTISLTLALMAGGISCDDLVLVPALTMVATRNAPALINRNVRAVDVDPQTLCMNIGNVLWHIERKPVKAIIYVSLNGRANDLEKLVKACKEKGILLIEDSAQSLGSFHNGKHLGTFGDIGSFSFSSQKIVSTGQGGCLITNNEQLYLKLKKLKDFGRKVAGSDEYDSFGINSKFTDLQAIVGIEQMKKLPERIKRKKEIIIQYCNELNSKVELIPPINQQLLWFMDIYVDEPDKLKEHLESKGIKTRRVYKSLASECKTAEKYSKRGLWLPSSIDLTDDEIHRVCKEVKKFYD